MKRKLSIAVLVTLGRLAAQQAPALRELRHQLDRLAAEQTQDAVPPVESFTDGINALKSSSQEDVKAILPSARACLRGPFVPARGHAQCVFIAVAIRFDSASLLAGYIEDLAAMLDDPAQGTRSATLAALGLMHPHPPAEIVRYVEPHLADATNTPMDLANLTAVLLAVNPNDDRIVKEIVAEVKKRGGLPLTASILDRVMAAKTTNEAALSFVEEFLYSADSAERHEAVRVLVGRSDILSRFAPKLHQIAADTSEDPKTREFAQEALGIGSGQ